MTGGNLPAMDPRHRREAPWNQAAPEPDAVCPYCGREYVDTRVLNHNEHHPDNTTVVKESRCTKCGLVISASRLDVTEGYLEAWRQAPREMEHTVDEYAELRSV